MITFTNDFEKAAYMERIAFRNFIKLYNLFQGEGYDIDIRPYEGQDVYDVLVSKHNDGSIYKRYIIELKIRDKDFDNEGYVYETKKHKSLTNIKNLDPDNNEILYINFTPNGTYIWFIDRIIGNYQSIKKEMNKATMNSRSDKSNKTTYLLLPKDAKHYQYRWDIKQFNADVEAKKQKEVKVKQRLSDEKDMWFYISGKNWSEKE
jgi:hypothetical protein